MTPTRLRFVHVPVVAGLIALLALIGAFTLTQAETEHPAPQRVSPAPAAPTPQPTKTPEASVSTQEPVTIAGSAILNVSVPAVGIDVKVSGETWPRQTEHCNASTYCIDPPVSNQAAWYGGVPSLPSVNPVLLFGHTSWSNSAYATFNNLPATVAGDEILVTTETGLFVYVAEDPVLVPYEQVAESELIFGNEIEKVVLVTCNKDASAGTVVVGRLVEARPL
jgi:sortase (surface protein transpeptidase)